MLFKNLLAAAAVVPLTLAQQTIYGECGGQYYSGPTSCAAGLTCVYFNPYYSQCLPNTTTSEGSTTSTSTTSTSTSSASKTSTSTSSASKTSTSTSSASKTSSTSSSSRSTSTVISTTKTTSTTSISATTTSTKSSSSVKSTSTVSTTSGTVTGASTTATITGNPFSGVALYANPYYSSEIYTSAIPSLTGSLAAQASLVAEVPTFVWLDKAAKVPLMGTYLGNIRALNKAGANPPVAGTFVVYDLPDRDCAALASNGEYTIADNGVANYFAYIDAIEALVVEYSDVKIILIIEPDSLANLVTNLNVAECAAAESAYLECIEYAIKTLNYPNVAMYLDAGHAGWLGWSANIGPAATLFAQVYTAAGSPSQVRGLATNVANYNAWTIATAPSYTSGDANYDEELYITALAPLLVTAGYPAHFITDTSRNGVQPTKQNAWGDWCNVIGTGFGVRPTTNTGNTLEDAFVWVKPGGECDGTSNTTSPRYDAHCGYSDALQPAPEAGTWFEAYFVQLLTNANPAF